MRETRGQTLDLGGKEPAEGAGVSVLLLHGGVRGRGGSDETCLLFTDLDVHTDSLGFLPSQDVLGDATEKGPHDLLAHTSQYLHLVTHPGGCLGDSVLVGLWSHHVLQLLDYLPTRLTDEAQLLSLEQLVTLGVLRGQVLAELLSVAWVGPCQGRVLRGQTGKGQPWGAQEHQGEDLI